MCKRNVILYLFSVRNDFRRTTLKIDTGSQPKIFDIPFDYIRLMQLPYFFCLFRGYPITNSFYQLVPIIIRICLQNQIIDPMYTRENMIDFPSLGFKIVLFPNYSKSLYSVAYFITNTLEERPLFFFCSFRFCWVIKAPVFAFNMWWRHRAFVSCIST